MAHIRTVKTASGARAVQIVYSRRKGARQIEHIGSAHDDAELERLKAVARQRIAADRSAVPQQNPPCLIASLYAEVTLTPFAGHIGCASHQQGVAACVVSQTRRDLNTPTRE